MQYQYSNYSEAVNHAANLVLTDRAIHRSQRMERLLELLHSLALAIPESWETKSRALLSHRERSIERIIHALSLDVVEHPELSEYFVLSSVLLLAFTIKQLGASDSVAESGIFTNGA